jgi:hypothetical protein
MGRQERISTKDYSNIFNSEVIDLAPPNASVPAVIPPEEKSTEIKNPIIRRKRKINRRRFIGNTLAWGGAAVSAASFGAMGYGWSYDLIVGDSRENELIASLEAAKKTVRQAEINIYEADPSDTDTKNKYINEYNESQKQIEPETVKLKEFRRLRELKNQGKMDPKIGMFAAGLSGLLSWAFGAWLVDYETGKYRTKTFYEK